MIDLESHHFGSEMQHREYHPQTLNFNKHLHRSFELWFCEYGTINISIDDCDYQIQKNELLLILPFQSHEIRSDVENQGHIWIFSPEYILDFYHQVQGKKFIDPVISITDSVYQRLYHLLFDNYSIFNHKCALYEILSHYESSTLLENSKVKDDITEKIAHWFSFNFDKNKTLTDLSDDIGYSKDYLSKIISLRFQSTFPDIINQYRINRACYLLLNTDYSITDISNIAGFQNMRTFNRNFLKIKNTSPKLYRLNSTDKHPSDNDPSFFV